MNAAARIYREHIEELTKRARTDDFALKTIFVIALLASGWRYDEPEPKKTNVVDLKRHKAKTAIRQNTHGKNR